MPIAWFLDLCLDTTSARRLRPFWAAVLGAEVVELGEGKAYVALPGSAAKVWMNEVPERKTVKNRIHLDVHCREVPELLQLGASVIREPTLQDHWWVLADPDGGEFCAFVREDPPAQRLYEIAVDAADARVLASWWGDLLGGSAQHDDAHGTWVVDVANLPAESIVFQTVPEPKTVKNRVHWDVRADVDAVLQRGATLLRGPTPEDNWHVLADPEGNEFCVFA